MNGKRKFQNRSDTESKRMEASEIGLGTPVLHIGGSWDRIRELLKRGKYHRTSNAIKRMAEASGRIHISHTSRVRRRDRSLPGNFLREQTGEGRRKVSATRHQVSAAVGGLRLGAAKYSTMDCSNLQGADISGVLHQIGWGS